MKYLHVAPWLVAALLLDAPALAQAETQIPETQAPTPPVEPAPFKGFLLRSEDGDFSLKVGGLVQADGRFFFDDDADDHLNTLAMRSARLDLRAKLGKYFGARLQPDFAGNKLTLLDATVSVGFIDEVQLRAGKMKSPMGLELLQPTEALLFPERGLPSLLVPNRDVGAVLEGELLKGGIAYTAGVFNGAADGTSEDTDTSDDKDVVGRVFLRPLLLARLDGAPDLGLGVAVSHGEQAQGTVPAFRTPGRETFFSYVEDTAATGKRTRVAPQAYLYYGPLGLLGELVRSTDHVVNGPVSRGVTSTAWQAAGSFVIGGEASYKGARVAAPLDPAAGNWGALELAARYGRLSIDDDAFDSGLADPSASASGARSWGLAASWWFIPGTRALVGFDRTTLEGFGERSSTKENVLVTRLQAAL